MGQLLDIAAEYFDAGDWDYVRLDDQDVLRLDVTGDNGRWICYVRAREAEGELIVYSNAPAHVPPDRRPAMAEFLTRANFGLTIGNFEMDVADGELHYKTAIDVTGDRLSQPLVDNLVQANLVIMDKYLPGILAVIDGAEPAAAVAEAEGGA